MAGDQRLHLHSKLNGALVDQHTKDLNPKTAKRNC